MEELVSDRPCDLREDTDKALVMRQAVAIATGVSGGILDDAADDTGFITAQRWTQLDTVAGRATVRALRIAAGLHEHHSAPVCIVLGWTEPELRGQYARTRDSAGGVVNTGRGRGRRPGDYTAPSTARVDVGCLWLLRERAAGRI